MKNFFMIIGSELEAVLANRRFDALASYVSCPFEEFWRFSIPTRNTAVHPHGRNGGVPKTLQFVDFGGQNEIALGKPVDLMSEDSDFSLAPTKADIGMMAL
ncbi:MAG: hypothetical protein QOK48_239 [Blastocatellia bacterium]|nr:hypothetical protein [Blastocatellia bacterium]